MASFRKYNYIYNQLTEGKLDSPLGLIAYGIYKNKKIEFIENWRKAHPESSEKGPSEEILEEFTKIASQHIDIYKEKAETILEGFCNAIISQHLDEYSRVEKEASEHAIRKVMQEYGCELGCIKQRVAPSKTEKFVDYCLSGIIGTTAFIVVVITVLFVIQCFFDDPIGSHIKTFFGFSSQ